MKKIIIWCFLVFCLSSCVSNINFPIDETEQQLVIYGTITDQPGPYVVQIHKTVQFFEPTSNIILNKISNAVVQIHDVEGNTEELTEVSKGVYKTSPNGMQGELYNSYFLTAEIDGNYYQSTVQKLMAVPEIDSITYNVSMKPVLLNNNVVNERPFLTITSNFQEIAGSTNFYGWKWLNVTKIRTFPELYTEKSNGMPILKPLPCSNYNNPEPCECCECWITSKVQNTLTILNDQFVEGNYLHKELFTIPITNELFTEKVYIRIYQHSMNEDIYRFWNQVIEQNESQSTLFAVPTAQVTGNIFNVNKKDELVWGIFSAEAVREDDIFINRNELGVYVPYIQDSIKNDCRKVAGATNQRPILWED